MEMASALFNQIYIKTEQKCFGFEYHTIGEIRFAAGDEAKKLLSAFVK
jgi:hypothetical protein